MKFHTTNYENTFIEIADDCPVSAAAAPPPKLPKTAAQLQFELITQNPYVFTSDDVLFEIFALKNNLSESEKPEARKRFFSKGQACMRSSPLSKRYGFGIHSNMEGKIALFPVESEQYKEFLKNANVKKVKAMRSKRA